jgi:dTDP-4-amino-4,6-dideoxygalactose transaminase
MIPFLDLRAQYQQVKVEVDAAIARVIDRGEFVLGPSVSRFEQRFAAYCKTEHCVALNSGTSALHLALLACDIGPGDEVITVSMTFVATIAAIRYCGAKPVFVDIDPDTWTMNPAAIKTAITPRTRAILPVHLHGLMADMDTILEIAREHSLVVIEDAAQSHGAEYKGRRAGGMGTMGCFSFYPGKNLGAYGEGGAVVTNDPRLAYRVRLLRDWGQETKYNHVLPGYNYRMEGIQGAVLEVKMGYIEEWTEKRRKVASWYNQMLVGCVKPALKSDSRHVYHVYAIQVPDRDEVQRKLTARGIGTGIHYPTPVHLQKAYGDYGYGLGDFPITESTAKRFLSLPMYAELHREQVEEVAACLNETCIMTV